MQLLFENDNRECGLKVVILARPSPAAFLAILRASTCPTNEHLILTLGVPFEASYQLVAAALAFAGTVVPLSAAQSNASQGADPLVGHAWVEAKPQSGLPGVMMVFLADGTLLMDSCWETYALRKWTRTAPDAVSWDEDGARVSAKIKSLTQSQLTLQVKAGKDVVEHRYTAGKAPYVCPDMKR